MMFQPDYSQILPLLPLLILFAIAATFIIMALVMSIFPPSAQKAKREIVDNEDMNDEP